MTILFDMATVVLRRKAAGFATVKVKYVYFISCLEC